MGPRFREGDDCGKPMNKTPCVYIMASKKNGTLYIGVTSNLVKRIWQHREGHTGGFAAGHGCRRLVYYEVHADITTAIAREKAMKKWNREWKIKRIEDSNPGWHDLYEEITG